MKGVSTRKVDDLVQALGMSGISKSQVSKLCSELDERVQSFLKRELTGQWPYVWLDATYLKSRENGHVVTRALVVAIGVNQEGRREVLVKSLWTGGDRSVLDRVPARTRGPRARRGAPGNLRRAPGAEECSCEGPGSDMATVSGPLHEEHPGVRAQIAESDGGRGDSHCVRPADS